MNLQPSKLSVAASQVWEESNSLFKNDEVKVDFGLDKTLNKNSNLSADNSKKVNKVGFIFGSKLSERVANPSDKSDSSNDDNKPQDVSSIFKKITAKSGDNLWKVAASSDVISTSDRLKESIAELEKMSQSTELSVAEPITTGEEDEKSLANISCKFFQYNNVETKTWVERGMGVLKVNQNKNCKDDVRLVGRSTGSQRVIVNSKIFPGMILEQLSEKRLKISALNPDAELPQLFIIQASPLSIASIHPLLCKLISQMNSSNANSTTTTSAVTSMNESNASRKRKPDDKNGNEEHTDNNTINYENENNSEDEPETSKKKFAPVRDSTSSSDS